MQCNKLIHITYELYPNNYGGIGVFVYMLLNEISKTFTKMKINVVVPVKEPFENKFESNNVSIVFIKDCYKDNKLNLPLFCEKLRIWLNCKENQDSIIHFHDITLYHFLSNYKNVVFTFHKDDGIFIPPTKSISASVYLTSYSQKKHLIPAEKKFVIPNGLSITERKARIAYIGRMSFEKGFNKFLNYCENSKKGNKYIVIGGSGKSSNNIQYLGLLDNKQVILELTNIDYILVPSLREEFCLVILEALKADKKVIVNNLKQLRELYSDFENVFFVDFYKNEFISKIDAYLEKDFYAKQRNLMRFSIKKKENKKNVKNLVLKLKKFHSSLKIKIKEVK